MKTLQVNKPVTSSQPQVGHVTIYTGNPIKPYEGGQRFTRQPADTKYKIYGAKSVPVVQVRFVNADADTDPFIVNESDFNPDLHEKV